MSGAGRVVYFHGIPGSGAELSLFGDEVAQATASFDVPDRRTGEAGSDAHFAAIARDLDVRNPGRHLHFIGFSLGASAALRTARLIPDRVARIDLVSPAAPLQTGDYLGSMAGARVFELAGSSPRSFALLARAQGGLARIAPGRLGSLLFASARGEDRVLANDRAFRQAMGRNLGLALAGGAATYRNELAFFLEDWTDQLSQITPPVSIWHGEEDNWSPPAMALALASHLRCSDAPTVWPGLSHYSALRRFLLRRLGAAC